MTRTAIVRNRITATESAIEDSSLTTGERFYVSSGSGSGSNAGTTQALPFASLTSFVSAATANRNDWAYVMPGHAETITAAGGITISKAGLTIKGLGNGSNRPTFTLGTSTAATFLITAENVKVQNCRFVCNIDTLATFINITGAGNVTFEDCEFITSSTKEALCFVTIPTTYDGFTFRRCRFFQPTDPTGTDGNAGTGCFYFEDSEDLLFEDCFFYGCFESAIFHNKTTAAKNVWVRRCYGTQLLSGAEVFVQVANMEGGVAPGHFVIPAATDVSEALTWGTMSDKFFISPDSGIGNDGVGGQLMVAGATAAS